MRSERQRQATVDDVLAGYYGRPRRRPSLEEVVGSYYGGGPSTRGPAIDTTGWLAGELSATEAGEHTVEVLPVDDGEAAEVPHPVPDELEEYVLPDVAELVPPPSGPPSGGPPLPSPPAAAPAGHGPSPAPSGTEPSTQPADGPRGDAPDGRASAGHATNGAKNSGGGSAPPSGNDQARPEPAGGYEPADAVGGRPDTRDRVDPSMQPQGQDAARMSEEDLAADLAAILSGERVFDPATKTTVPADQVGRPAPPRARTAPPGPSATGDGANGQAIFDRIAESLSYANAYDLGTVELANRFADFDRLEDQRSAPGPAPAPPAAPVGAGRPVLGSEDVLGDLDRIRRGADAVADATRQIVAPRPPAGRVAPHSHEGYNDDAFPSCRRPALNLEPDDESWSAPFYDSGEHALAGGDQYVDQLRVGRNPGVRVSYGQIVAMPDLYGTVDELVAADLAEVTELKRLVERSTAFYRGNKSDPSLDVSNAEWDRVTRGRYLELAQDNYEHFAPDDLHIGIHPPSHGDHRTAWEAHHRRAVDEARREILAGQAAGQTVIPEQALIINAFGDHFLTDAFASGHLVNKDALIQQFLSRFFSGSALTSAGDAFFGRVADAAFVGNVRRRFSVLETVDTPVCAWGWCLAWHPNINSVSRFKTLLTTAATTEPVKVANIAVKALHDHLNQAGVEVSNAAGDGPWMLTGDGHLNATSLQVMRRAVLQSIANINDPAILTGSVDYRALFDRVWRLVPQPTAPARARLTALATEYTSPTSTTLSTAAANIISTQVDSMIQELVRRGKLRPA